MTVFEINDAIASICDALHLHKDERILALNRPMRQQAFSLELLKVLRCSRGQNRCQSERPVHRCQPRISYFGNHTSLGFGYTSIWFIRWIPWSTKTRRLCRWDQVDIWSSLQQHVMARSRLSHEDDHSGCFSWSERTGPGEDVLLLNTASTWNGSTKILARYWRSLGSSRVPLHTFWICGKCDRLWSTSLPPMGKYHVTFVRRVKRDLLDNPRNIRRI